MCASGHEERGRPLGVGPACPSRVTRCGNDGALWGAATMGAAASPSEASQPSGTLSMFLSVLVWALATANQKPHAACLGSALARLPALQLTQPRFQTLGTGRIQLQIQIQQSPRAPFHGYVHARLGLLRHPLAGPLQQLVSDRHSKIRPYPEDGAHNR